jgi:hypothetical protein
MSDARAKQERTGTTAISLVAVFLAVMAWIDRPEPGAIVEAVPDWYSALNLALHGAILALLLVALLRLPRMIADRAGLRLPFLAMILVGVVAAAYVLGRDLGLV